MDLTTHKIVAVINKKLDTGVALNAASHLGLGLAARAADEQPNLLIEMKFINFEDKDGGAHPFISALSLIVLRASSSEIRKVRDALRESRLLFVDFTNEMTGDTYVEQLERSRRTPESSLDYYGLCAIGRKEQLDPITRKLSLWR